MSLSILKKRSLVFDLRTLTAELVSIALEFCRAELEPRGTFVVKVFQGESFNEVFAAMKAVFREVLTRKPAASRAESRETYLVGRGLRA